MQFSNRTQEIPVIDSLGNLPAKLSAGQLNYNNLDEYAVFFLDRGVMQTKIISIHHESEGHVRINNVFNVRATNTVVTYHKPLKFGINGIEVKG